jgi:hypothetical protein
VAISLVLNSFGIASVRLLRSCGMSSKRSMKESHLKKRPGLILSE